MPVANPPQVRLPSQRPPYAIFRLTVDEYMRLVEAGVLHEDHPIELLEGWLVEKMPKNAPHDGTIDLVEGELLNILPAGWYPRVQNTVLTGDSAPEPDLAVVRGTRRDFLRRHPSADDVALIVEVADSSVARDRKKGAIYARAGIPHYWIVNLEESVVEAYSEPNAKRSSYRVCETLELDGTVTWELPDGTRMSLVVRQLLPEESV